ncbi:MAG: hypothetical protein O2894_12365 [Planctomycetota bacterium]|nr:hypothetical protein [Planctomycetota bacterium]
MILSESHVLEALARVVVEDAEAACRREEDRARNAGRAVVLEAEDRIAELTAAAKELGRTRGRAVEVAEVRAGEAEIATLEAGALDALFERFLRHVLMAIKALPQSPGYDAAVRAWAGHAARTPAGPCEVSCAKRDRPLVYAALVAAGVTDFQVLVDHRVHGGFVLRELDGRTRYDCRAEALVEAARAPLRALLEQGVPPPPEGLGAVDVAEPAAAVPDFAEDAGS